MGEVAPNSFRTGPPQPPRGSTCKIAVGCTGKPAWWLAHPSRHVDIRGSKCKTALGYTGKPVWWLAPTPAAMWIYGARKAQLHFDVLECPYGGCPTRHTKLD